VFEAEHSERTTAPADAVWALWADPGRWAEWDPRVERAETEAPLEIGAEVKVKLRKGGTTRHRVVELDPGRTLVTEYALPGARAGHAHELMPARGGGTEVVHRLYVDGPLAGLWALMLGRKRMRETVAGFAERERELLAG
jgi:uncharacterized protein YndB with AHSA1/START domain